jgi:hypothetical protein
MLQKLITTINTLLTNKLNNFLTINNYYLASALFYCETPYFNTQTYALVLPVLKLTPISLYYLVLRFISTYIMFAYITLQYIMYFKFKRKI